MIKSIKEKVQNFMAKLAYKAMSKAEQYVLSLRRAAAEQRGDLPSWVNIVGMIAIIAVILILVWQFLPNALKDLIQSYLDKIKNTIV